MGRSWEQDAGRGQHPGHEPGSQPALYHSIFHSMCPVGGRTKISTSWGGDIWDENKHRTQCGQVLGEILGFRKGTENPGILPLANTPEHRNPHWKDTHMTLPVTALLPATEMGNHHVLGCEQRKITIWA